jgi:hypothetical protein
VIVLVVLVVGSEVALVVVSSLCLLQVKGDQLLHQCNLQVKAGLSHLLVMVRPHLIHTDLTGGLAEDSVVDSHLDMVECLADLECLGPDQCQHLEEKEEAVLQKAEDQDQLQGKI